LKFINQAAPQLDKHQLDLQEMKRHLVREREAFRNIGSVRIDPIVIEEAERRLVEVVTMIYNPFSSYFAKVVFKDAHQNSVVVQSLIEQSYIRNMYHSYKSRLK
jgi:hypothetical protein